MNIGLPRSSLLPLKLSFNHQPAVLKFVVDSVALGQVYFENFTPVFKR
jgi:hypothetical protein